MAEELDQSGEVELEGDPDLIIASREFEKITESRIKTGYLEGIETGKQQGLEQGFHDGFKRGLQCELQWSILRGKTSALQTYSSKLAENCEPSSTNGQVNLQVNELLEAVRDKETRWREKQHKEETETYARSHMADATGMESQGMATASISKSATLKDFIPVKETCTELEELHRRLDELRIQIKQHRDLVVSK